MTRSHQPKSQADFRKCPRGSKYVQYLFIFIFICDTMEALGSSAEFEEGSFVYARRSLSFFFTFLGLLVPTLLGRSSPYLSEYSKHVTYLPINNSMPIFGSQVRGLLGSHEKKNSSRETKRGQGHSHRTSTFAFSL